MQLILLIQPYFNNQILLANWTHYLDAKEESSGVLDLVLDGDEEGHGLPAVDKAVVVGQGQVHHGAGLDLAVLGHLQREDDEEEGYTEISWEDMGEKLLYQVSLTNE